MLCGVADCTFRKVFEYSAESTRVLAAEYAAGLRTALRYFAQDTNTNKHRSGGFPDVAGTELPRTGTTPVRGSFFMASSVTADGGYSSAFIRRMV